MQLGTGPDGPIRGRRVAITGLGAITCCGVGVDALWDGLLHPSVVGGPVRDYDPERWFGSKEVRQLDRFAQEHGLHQFDFALRRPAQQPFLRPGRRLLPPHRRLGKRNPEHTQAMKE